MLNYHKIYESLNWHYINNSSNNGNRFEIILPGNTDKGKNYIINEDCCIRLWSRIQKELVNLLSLDLTNSVTRLLHNYGLFESQIFSLHLINSLILLLHNDWLFKSQTFSLPLTRPHINLFQNDGLFHTLTWRMQFTLMEICC